MPRTDDFDPYSAPTLPGPKSQRLSAIERQDQAARRIQAVLDELSDRDRVIVTWQIFRVNVGADAVPAD